MITRRVLRRLIWVYTVCQCPFYGTLGINGLTFTTLWANSVDDIFFFFFSRKFA